MRKRPTIDAHAAIARLERAIPYLQFLNAPFGYGGSIEGDLFAVLQAAEQLLAPRESVTKRKYDSTVARIAGNVATAWANQGYAPSFTAEFAVQLARAIVAEVIRTEPPVDNGEDAQAAAKRATPGVSTAT